MKPLPAVPSAMNRKPLPALPPTMNGNMPSGNRRRNSPRRVSFSTMPEDDSRPRFRNPKDQTYPRGCLNRSSTTLPNPPPHQLPSRAKANHASSPENQPVQRAKVHHAPGEKCVNLACSTCKAKIADWISDTSERIALDEGMPPETLSISAFQRVFYEDEDTACDFKNQTAAEAINQLTGGNECDANNATQDGVITQIIRIIALSLCQKVEDPYEVHARKRAERRMKRVLSGRDLDEDNKKRRRRKRSADSVDISVKTFFVTTIQDLAGRLGRPGGDGPRPEIQNRIKSAICSNDMFPDDTASSPWRYCKKIPTTPLYQRRYPISDHAPSPTVRLRNHTTTAPRPPRKLFTLVGQIIGKEDKKDEDKATEDPTKDVTRKGEEDQDKKKETEKKETEKKETEKKETEKKETVDKKGTSCPRDNLYIIYPSPS
ncbi:hypothetical protein QBC37DRAFT_401440 [Rhypophila decipiens]|uniref:Uncharacterized protein n=1 Tax=Rhypophila decipiens TaxID=261697 RepID=A0AAN7B6D6_9PEZI|nr:hypothetical protein QBC37DRAFT_401440 [Rhypophila decipiens]